MSTLEYLTEVQINLNLGDLDSLVQKLKSIQENLEEKQKEQEEVKKSAYQRNMEADRLKKLSLVAGKSFDLEAVPEKAQLKEIEAEIIRLKTGKMELEKQIANGVSEVKFPIKSSTPEISKGDAIFYLEEGAYENAISYLKRSLSIREQLVIDDVVIHTDKIVVRGKSKADEATDCLANAAQSIWALGSIMLGKVPEEMRETIDSLKKSKYKHLWEFIGPRGSVSLKSTYENFKLKDETEQKRARTFYSQLESLRTPPLATGDGKGMFQLTIYGRLVWASYKKTCAISEEKTEEVERVSEAQEVEEAQPTETKRKPSQTALQNFMEKVLLEEGD